MVACLSDLLVAHLTNNERKARSFTSVVAGRLEALTAAIRAVVDPAAPPSTTMTESMEQLKHKFPPTRAGFGFYTDTSHAGELDYLANLISTMYTQLYSFLHVWFDVDPLLATLNSVKCELFPLINDTADCEENAEFIRVVRGLHDALVRFDPAFDVDDIGGFPRPEDFAEK